MVNKIKIPVSPGGGSAVGLVRQELTREVYGNFWGDGNIPYLNKSLGYYTDLCIYQKSSNSTFNL